MKAAEASGLSAELHIYVDADACPVKEEIYRVSARTRIAVTIVANSWFRVPQSPLITREVVSDGFDAADDWIAQRASAGTIVVTSDILLADRCVRAGAAVLAPNGKAFTADMIGSAVATRAIKEDLRAGANLTNAAIGGPAPFSKADRSAFLQALDREITRLTKC